MIGERIRTARLAAKLKQADLAKAVNRGVSTISEWEAEKRTPDVALLPDIAETLKVSVAYLVGETEDPTPGNRLTLTEAAVYARSLWPNAFRFLLGCAGLVEVPDADANVTIRGPGISVVEDVDLMEEVMQQTLDFFEYLLYKISIDQQQR